MSREKGVERAIEIARLVNLPLIIAARIYPEERAYFDSTIAPLLDASQGLVHFVGEIGGREKEAFLGNARALLFPIEWAEPFGLVMIESLACGTPVIAWRRGSVPEVIDDGVTGFIVDSVDAAVRAVGRLDEIDRRVCRRTFEARFDANRMACEYVKVYERVIGQTMRP
jgi:glycosyltransferase involved in cell wall biosynthesis